VDYLMASWLDGRFDKAAMAGRRQEESKMAGMAGLRGRV